MAKSSKSRSDEYDPIIDHHFDKFELRRLKGSGEEFQQLFEDIMVRAKPGFARVRPYGNIGDRKCDGLFQKDGQFFQVYSPDELKQAKTQKKINDDLDGAIANWGDSLKAWTFVYNVNKGVPPNILETLDEKRKQYPNIKIDHLSNDGLWEIARKLSTQQRCEILGAPPLESKRKLVSESLGSDHDETNWPELCRKMLPTELDSNPLISGDGVTLGIEDILPLDLAERKEKPRPTRDPSPENFQQTLEEQEIPLPYDQLFTHVLLECKSLNQQGKGIAFIGEPGAGKTTLLCTIAHWILERDELPIFVSLRDLDGKLEDYVLQTWLRNAGNVRKASEQLQDALVERCNASQVWLLLDGIDEMSKADRTLYNLAQELKKGWLGNARVVLTCRINIWDANRNDLDSGFEKIKSKGFKYEDQILFIRKFFTKARQPEIGEKLTKEIKNAPLRLKDLIKSPLWITLLCRTWKRKTGKLPKTKAELYRGFANTFYEWKNKPYIPEEKRPLLEQALGELSTKAIDQEDFRFRLPESFIREELDKHDPIFLNKACQLGWINKLGLSEEEDLSEPVYAFLHPTFQEYFAALSISQGDFFFPVDQGTNTHEEIGTKKYRAFEPQWEEVMNLWLGKIPKDGSLIKSKKKLLCDLLSFQDNCGGFYSLKSYFLVARSFDEVYELLESESDSLLSSIIKYAFGYFDEVKLRWIFFQKPIRGRAKSVIWGSSKIKTMLKNQLLQLIDACPRDHDRREIAMILEKMGICNEKTRSIIKAKVSFKVPPHIAKYCNLIAAQVKAPSSINPLIQADGKALPLEDSFHMLDDNLYVNMDLHDLIEQIKSTDDWLVITKVTEHLKSKTEVFQSLEIVRNLKTYIDPCEEHRSNFLETKHFRYEYIYEVVWNCCQNLSYTDFYKAWNTIAFKQEQNHVGL